MQDIEGEEPPALTKLRDHSQVLISPLIGMWLFARVPKIPLSVSPQSVETTRGKLSGVGVPKTTDFGAPGPLVTRSARQLGIGTVPRRAFSHIPISGAGSTGQCNTI